MPTGDGVRSSGCGILAISEGAHDDSDSMVVVYFFDGLLDLVSGLPEGLSLSKVGCCPCPDHGHILGSSRAAPEGEGNDVIVVGFGIPRHSKSTSNGIPVPRCAPVDVAHSERVGAYLVGPGFLPLPEVEAADGNNQGED